MSEATKALEVHLANSVTTEEELMNFVRMMDSRAHHQKMEKLKESIEKGDIDPAKVDAVFHEAEAKRTQREAREAAEAKRAAVEEQKRIDATEAAEAEERKKAESK